MSVQLHGGGNHLGRVTISFIRTISDARSGRSTDAVQLMVTPRKPNLHFCAAAWGRKSSDTRNNQLHQNYIRRTARQNIDAFQLMVTPRHPNLHVCAAAWGRESEGMRNNRFRQKNIRRMANELAANICIGGSRLSNSFQCRIYHHQQQQQQH